eukprot:PhF_6_TR31545/c0_g2_i3/m.46556
MSSKLSILAGTMVFTTILFLLIPTNFDATSSTNPSPGVIPSLTSTDVSIHIDLPSSITPPPSKSTRLQNGLPLTIAPFTVKDPTFAKNDDVLKQLQKIGERCGYNNIVYNSTSHSYEIARHKVRNELFLLALDDEKESAPLVQSINNVLFPLDDAIHKYLASLRTITLRPPKPGMGRTGRGWGITSPFSNKWKYYVTHLLAVKAKYVCEVGFLAGHSAGVFVGAMRHANLTIEAFNEFDMIQPGTSWHEPAVQFFKKELGAERFFMHEGKSCKKAVMAKNMEAMKQCDFISLDGGKRVKETICDLKEFFDVSTPSYTVLLTDDVNPSLIRSKATPAPDKFHDHHDVLRYFVQQG